jgi:hypothetical protein
VSTETGWDVQLVYPECYYYQVSLRLDSEARPHISFRDKTTLRHAHLTRDGWQADALQEGAGLFNALVLNSADEPLIAFYDQTKPALKLAQWQAGEFRIQVVDDSGDAGNSVSMVIDERDLVHLAYRDQASDLLKVATGHAGCDDWDIRVVDSKAGSGWYSSLALDEAGRVHLAYVWTLNGSHELRLARNLTGTWEVFSGIDTRTDLGYASLAFLDGKPRISYHKGGFTSNGSQLCFASW